MHILETYALNCGAKISKPYIYTTFFPLPIEHYITFHSEDAQQAKNYDYWQDVINILNPILQANNIKMIQLGGPKDRDYSDVIRVKGQANANQIAHIIERSMLHFGAEGFFIQLASHFGIPLVSLHSNNFVECAYPYFGSSEKQIVFDSYSLAKAKPSFSAEENPKTINLIKPEEIANAVVKLLGIDFVTPFETVFTGSKYCGFLIQESLPDAEASFNPELQVEIRADLAYNEASFVNQLARYNKSIVVMDKPISIDILRRFKDNIVALVFKVSNDSHKDFLKQLQGLGRNLILVSSLPEEQINALKIHYYEFGNVNSLSSVSEDKINELKKDLPLLYYRSAKIVTSEGKYYYSLAAKLRDLPMKNHHEYQKVIDCPEFWENLDCFTIVKSKETA